MDSCLSESCCCKIEMGDKTKLSFKLDNIILGPGGYSVLFCLMSRHGRLFCEGLGDYWVDGFSNKK